MSNTQIEEQKKLQREQQQIRELAQQKQIKEKQSSVKDLLEKYRGSISQALPKHITADRMMRVALTAMTKTPDLLFCTQHSLISAVITAGQLGLMPDSVLGECYLIPFNNTRKGTKECQIIVGYRGLCALAMRSGQVASVQARAVYAANEEGGDMFEYELGLEEKLKHVPNGLTDNNRITHFYAIVKFKGGGHVFNVMTRKEVESVRDESKNYQFAKDKAETIWGKYFDEMGCKTVLRRLMKFVPLSPEIQQAIGTDEAAEGGRQKLGVEILDAPETDQEMIEDIEAELVEDEFEEQEKERMRLEQQEEDKVKAANENLDQILKNRPANKSKKKTDF